MDKPKHYCENIQFLHFLAWRWRCTPPEELPNGANWRCRARDDVQRVVGMIGRDMYEAWVIANVEDDDSHRDLSMKLSEKIGELRYGEKERV